jgi:DNA polymerase-3 subunit delta'
MDKQTDSVTPSNPLLIAATQLWVGEHKAVMERVTEQLQKVWCSQQGCNTCNTCIQIRDHQHHAIMWLAPEKTYTKDQFDDVFQTMSFALEQGANYFFIIQKADTLPHAPANRLLKVLEEPPAGYHFILISERPDQLMPTIKSRCVVHELRTESKMKDHPLFSHFSGKKLSNPISFLKELDQSKINEQETIDLLDSLLKYWADRYKNNADYRQRAFTVLAVLKKGFEMPPMPGSSKIFWQDIYLQLM